MELLYFLAGLLTCQYILPILDSLTSCFTQEIESWKGKAMYRVAKYKKQIAKLEEEERPVIKGFGIDPDFTEEDDE